MQQINTTENSNLESIFLRNLFIDIDPFDKIDSLLKNKTFDLNIFNVIGASSSFLISIFSRLKENKLIIVNGEAETQKLYANLFEILSDEEKNNLLIFPDSSVIPYEKISPSYDTTGEQLNVLYKLITSDSNIIIAPIRSLFNPVINENELRKSIIELSINSEISLEELRNDLVSFGYSLEKSVERVGETSYRGGIIDIFSPTEKYPARIEFTDNIISSIRFFDPITQLSINKTESYIVIPMSQFILDQSIAKKVIDNVKEYSLKNKVTLDGKILNDLDKLSQLIRFSGIEHYFPFTRKAENTLIDYFDDKSLIFFINLEDLTGSFKALSIEATEIYGIEKEKKEVIPLNFTKYLHETFKKINSVKKIIKLDKLPLSETIKNQYALPIRIAESILSGDFKGILNQYLADNGKVLITTKQQKRVIEIIENLGFNVPSDQIIIEDLYLSEGFFYPEKKFALLTDKELFGWKSSHKHYKRFKEGIPIKSIEDLKEGDILVHYSYGIGIYRGLAVVPDQEGNKKEFLLMEYSRGDKLYVPPERINMVNKYVGEAESITLSSLGTAEWERVRERAKVGAKELAEELLKLYAQREISKGYSFSNDGPWQHELELSFPYEETPDQLAAIRDVKRDMEDKKIMDRIVTGDVGYGKTEVAIRAAFKAINDSKQVAFLVPTTILANQHYETLKERFAPYPVDVELLSRMVSARTQTKIFEKIKDGKVDLVIGTHKLLSSKIEFKRLGLLIIDEEHKFGVKHKEQIKKLKENVDVLTLTATPIPRTLSMAISGIREISHIDTSPEGRKPVKTYVMPYDTDVIRDAVKFELARGGQVYYVHNRIQDILRVKEELRKILPDIRISIAHGRMTEDEIDSSMTRFLKGEIDLLLCTTIIESGIDIPTVNTIIIEDADKLGLAQMYQLRGRVGRSTRRAYAYFFYPQNKMIEKKAYLRLDAIKEFVELGSGLKIALRDLEIRGAGNFLGDEQHGYIRTVGYHLYIQLLKEAIDELKFEKGEIKEPFDLTEFPISGYIPSSFIRDDGERLSIYQELVGSKSIDEIRKLRDEFIDKYGVFPEEFDKFYENLELRIIASEKGLSSVKVEENLIFFNFNNDRLNINVDNVSKMIKKFGNRIRFKPEAIIVRKDNYEFNETVKGVTECL